MRNTEPLFDIVINCPIAPQFILKILLFPYPANTNLICNTCNRSENSECKNGTGQCTAPEGGSCSTISIYHGQRHVLSKQMCLGHCEEKPHYNGDFMIYVMCCSKNLCNSF
uniref:UPAR/Ly6 domain-containing protein n=1 Tax=Rattus norvegicus TaxID=10116 RepID=A0A8I5Y6V7_RAT